MHELEQLMNHAKLNFNGGQPPAQIFQQPVSFGAKPPSAMQTPARAIAHRSKNVFSTQSTPLNQKFNTQMSMTSASNSSHATLFPGGSLPDSR